jgi:hypothetical protein
MKNFNFVCLLCLSTFQLALTLQPTGGNRFVDLELNPTGREIHLGDGTYGLNQQWILEEVGPIEVMMSNGRGVIYVYPTDNDTGLVWASYATNIGDLTNIPSQEDINNDFKGAANTATIVNQLKTDNAIYAAKLCADLVAYGFDDWYLPAAGELNEIYKKLGPNGSGEIITGYYWSSSERNTADAWGQYFDHGIQYAFNKDDKAGCRCVRR